MVIRLITLLFNVIFMMSILASTQMPIGIPSPWVDPNISKPARPNPWTSEVAGYYYVKDAAGSTDSGRTYGSPSAPRLTVPRPIPAGSYIEIEGPYNNTVAGVVQFQGGANTGTWSANSSGPAWITTSPISQGVVDTIKSITHGTAVYIDGLAWTNGSQCQIGSGADGFGATNIMIRNCFICGTKAGANTGLAGSGTTGYGITNTLFYNNLIWNWGNTNSLTDDDACGIIAGREHSANWNLNNTVYGCAGSGMRMGGSAEADDPDLSTGHYCGSNYVYDVRQSGIATKYGANVVYSQNKIRNVITTSWSPSKGLFAQYAPKGLWILYNDVSGCEYGIRIASTSGSLWGATWYIYAIGNTISNCYFFDAPYNPRSSGEGAIHLDGGTHRYVIGNTITDSDAGILFSCNGGTVVCENNIIGHIRQSSAHIWVENTTGIPNLSVKNNFISPTSESVRICWASGPTVYSSVSAFNTAQSSVASGNLSGDVLFGTGVNPWFRIRTGSPAIDAGLPDSELFSNVYNTYESTFGVSIKYDMFRTPRPKQSAWDIGAVEWNNFGSRLRLSGTSN